MLLHGSPAAVDTISINGIIGSRESRGLGSQTATTVSWKCGVSLTSNDLVLLGHVSKIFIIHLGFPLGCRLALVPSFLSGIFLFLLVTHGIDAVDG
jgi:hypothetical protein